MDSVSSIPALPRDVVEYVREVFSTANGRVAERLDRVPHIHEESLDFTFIEAISVGAGPHRVASGAIVDIDLHWVGSGWHYDRWEIADIGVIVNFRVHDELVATKAVLLQCKRIYPREVEFTEQRGLTRAGGFGSLMQPSPLLEHSPRTFTFDESCRYRALQTGDAQWAAILAYETQFGIPVYYMLYHPSQVPSSVTVPVQVPIAPKEVSDVGCRVLGAQAVRQLLASHARNYAPAYADLKQGDDAAPGTAVENFMADQVLGCRAGYVAGGPSDQGLIRMFQQRGAPIAAAIRFDIDLGDADVVEP